jgi:hypothetical protein
MIEDIMALHKTWSASIAYFYCDFRDEDKQNHRSILLSILFQLSAQTNLCLHALSKLYSEHDDGAQKPSDTVLKACLNDVLSLPDRGPVFLIVDALDECTDSTGMPSSREQVLDLVQNFVGLCPKNLHVCVTSRPEIDIKTSLESLTSLRVSSRTEWSEEGHHRVRQLCC